MMLVALALGMALVVGLAIIQIRALRRATDEVLRDVARVEDQVKLLAVSTEAIARVLGDAAEQARREP